MPPKAKAPKIILPAETEISLHFPFAGINDSWAFGKQPNVPVASRYPNTQGVPPGFSDQPVVQLEYARSTPVGINVRAYDTEGRRRGGSRPGLKNYVDATINGVKLVQDIKIIVGTGYSPPGGMPVQQSNSGRVVTLVGVSGGFVFVTQSGETQWFSTNNVTTFSPPLNANGIVYSAQNNQALWFADGSNWCVYYPVNNQVRVWGASAGALPVDSAGNKPRLIASWRGRIVLSGLLFDPQSIFMSAVGDPTNFDYAPLSPSATDAVALTVGQQGFVGDVVTCLIAYNNDTLVIGTDHTLQVLSGDPLAGGRLDQISDVIGMTWGTGWCKDPYGTLFFCSNQMGVYSYQPGQGLPQRISQAIDDLIHDVNTGTNTITMIWDDQYQGFHLFITPTAAAAAATHYFYEARTNAWWMDVFGSTDFNPLCCCTFDGNLPTDRVALIGSWDGFVRYFDPAESDDDGETFTSDVLIGPINSKNLDELICKDAQAVLGETSGDVTYEILTGSTAEEAISATASDTGTWTAGRNLSNHVRYSGHALFVRVTTTNRFAVEAIRLRVASEGKVRQRGA